MCVVVVPVGMTWSDRIVAGLPKQPEHCAFAHMTAQFIATLLTHYRHQAFIGTQLLGSGLRFRYVLHPFAAKYSHWMWH
jgi:hypothetical protein